MNRWFVPLWFVLGVALASRPAAADDSVAAAYRRSYAHEAAARYTDALNALDALPSPARTSYTYWLRRGWLLHLAGRSWDSVEAYRAAVAIHPEAIEPRLGLMLPLMGLRLWIDTLIVGEEIARRDPHNYLANTRRAWANYNLGRFAAAEGLYREVLAAYPADIEMRAGLGWSLLQQKRCPAAKREFAAVLRVAPDHAAAAEGLTQCS